MAKYVVINLLALEFLYCFTSVKIGNPFKLLNETLYIDITHPRLSGRIKPHVDILYCYFKNSLIIHEEKTKKNNKRVVSSYVIEIYLDLHKL